MKDIKFNNKKQALIDELKVKWYNWLCLNSPIFECLGLDERGILVNCVVEYVMENEMIFLVENAGPNDADEILTKCSGYA